MKRNIICAILCLAGIGLCACGSKAGSSENVQKESIQSVDEKLDYSDCKSDISSLMEDNITEARIYWGDKIYSTKDTSVILELKNKLNTMQLKEISKEEIEERCGSYNLYLLSGNKVLYELYCDGYMISMSGKYYNNDNGACDVFREAIDIAKNTFWKD